MAGMAPAAAPLKIGDTFGALLIGALVTMSVYGITTLQVYFYYLSFPNDGYPTRVLVLVIWILDTLHAIFMCHAVHYYLVDGFSDRRVLADGTWSLFSSIAINALMAFIVQCFFTNRIFRLCSPRRRWWVSGVIAVCVVAHFAFGMETVANLFIKKKFSRLHELSVSSVVPFGVSAILSDILIAVTLCILLARNRTSFEDTNNIINKLIIYAINRCLLTSAVAIIETVMFSVLPNSFYTFALDFVMGKLYANSLLAVLNSRANLRVASTQEDCSTELSTRIGFNVPRSVVVTHPTSLIQVRSRDSTRRHITEDLEKAEDFNRISSQNSRKDARRLSDDTSP